MTRKLPLVPTLLVGLAVAAMIGLGIWQLERRAWKHALIARYTENLAKPPIAFPRLGDPEALYRKASAMCVAPVGWQRRGGHGANGTSGYRLIAECRGGGLEGPPIHVEIGVTRDPKAVPAWKGGKVSGTIVALPTDTSLLGSLLGGGDGASGTPMLVADTPAPGLEPSARPDPRSIPDNHLAYAVQWFLFAGIAVIVYLLALRRRQKRSDTPPPPSPPTPPAA